MMILDVLILFLAIEHVGGTPFLGEDDAISLRSEGGCEDGWIKDGRSCYYFSQEEETYSWPKALLQCRARGGYLAEINTERENTFIEEQAKFLGSTSSEMCFDSFLTGINKIPDSALTASSSYNADHGTDRSRLNTLASSGKRGAWCAGATDRFQWIQADLQRPVQVTGIITQGRSDYSDQWVSQFVVSYSIDCKLWNNIQDINGAAKMFTGNFDRNTPVKQTFVPVIAKCIRIHPREWHGYISMRFDVLGCPLDTRFSLWLGGTDILHEGDWMWATSGTWISTDTFHDWHPRKPNNGNNNEHCLMLSPLTGWDDVACSVPSRYVCEKDTN